MAPEGALERSPSEGWRAVGSRLAASRVLASVLVLLLGASGGRDATAAHPEAPENGSEFTYEQYCDAQGRFTYDGAALKLVRRPAHLERVYADAGRGEARARELVRELEHWFHQAGVLVADTIARPACLPLPELTPECQPNWQFLKEFLGDTREAERLRQVVAHAYEVRARERGLQNKAILAGVNLLLVGGVAKGLMTQAAATEARGAAAQALAAETKAAKGAVRPTSSPHYSVGYEARLSRGTHYPGQGRPAHFQEANRQLHAAFEADPAFAASMERLYPGIVQGVRPGAKGAFPRRAPTPDVTWHHAPEEGVMQLVPRTHHTVPGPVQESLHPGGQGGMSIWGE